MFDLILDSVEDFHTVEERRLHRIFGGLRTPDYYLTTVLEDTKKTGSHCGAMVPRFALFPLCICAKPLKPLGHQGFSVDGLITPTLKAAGSNPVGRTKRIPRAATALGIFILSSTHWQQVKAVMINAMAIGTVKSYAQIRLQTLAE